MGWLFHFHGNPPTKTVLVVRFWLVSFKKRSYDITIHRPTAPFPDRSAAVTAYPRSPVPWVTVERHTN
ncbi:CRISPR-associated protein Cas5 [Ochrobactrum sp. 19YEA23]|uniref:CRISPR-associated protein Cas5 n=1 Tax=Ochrobactrum sp. 19YEA23 TaxID=3039854 RepID=UPI00370999B7